MTLSPERLDADLSAWSETNDGRQTLKPVAPAFLTPEGKPLMFMGEQKKEWPRLPDRSTLSRVT